MNKAELEKLLRERKVPLHKWGKNGKLTIDHLLGALEMKEIFLVETKQKIELHIKQVILKVKHMGDKPKKAARVKCLVPPHTDAKQAVERILKKDLGIGKNDSHKLSFLGTKEKTKKSRYYPGLIAHRKIYLYKVVMHD